jgi:hypothetical protein
LFEASSLKDIAESIGTSKTILGRAGLIWPIFD